MGEKAINSSCKFHFLLEIPSSFFQSKCCLVIIVKHPNTNWKWVLPLSQFNCTNRLSVRLISHLYPKKLLFKANKLSINISSTFQFSQNVCECSFSPHTYLYHEDNHNNSNCNNISHDDRKAKFLFSYIFRAWILITPFLQVFVLVPRRNFLHVSAKRW